MSPWRLALLGIARHRRAAATVVLCLALALAAGSALLGVVEGGVGFADDIRPQHDVVVGPKSEGMGLVIEALELREPNEDVIPYGMFHGMSERFQPAHIVSLHVFARYRDAFVVGTEDAWLQRPSDMESPRMIEGRWFADDREAVVGVAAARRLGLRSGDRLTVRASPSSRMVDAALTRKPELRPRDRFDPAPAPFEEPGERALWQRELTVTGVIDHGGGPMDDVVFVHRDVAGDYHLRGFGEDIARKVSRRGATTYVLVRLASSDQWPELRRYVHQGSTVQIAHIARELDRLRGLADQGRAAALSVAGVVLLLAVLSIGVLLNARFDTLLPRLGLLRALGYRRRSVAAWLVTEGLLLAGAAVVVALILHLVLVAGLDLPGRVGLPLGSAWPGPQGLLLWAAAPAAVLPAALIPLVRLARVDLRAALHAL